MPWLADLVQSSEGSLDVLPVQCLCEFLLHDAADAATSGEEEDEGESKERRAKKRQVGSQDPFPARLNSLSCRGLLAPDNCHLFHLAEAAEAAAAPEPLAGPAAGPEGR